MKALARHAAARAFAPIQWLRDVAAKIAVQHSHSMLMWKLRDLEERERYLMREIDSAQRELMRIRGKEAMLRYKLRVM